jgi:hypothetical protein
MTDCRRSSRSDEGGSALIAAVTLVAVIAVLAGVIAVRATGVSVAAAALADRAEARALAERVLMTEIARLDADGDRLTTSGSVASGPIALAGIGQGIVVDGGRAEVSGTVEHDPWFPQAIVRVEAQVGEATHEARAVVRARSTTDHLWLSEHRAIDPALYERPRIDCTWPPGDERRHAGCIDVPLGPGVLDGPVHSNEPLLFVPGTELRSLASVADHAAASSPELLDAATNAPSAPIMRSELSLPRDVGDVLRDVPVTCRFRGPTLIRLDGHRIRVRSPLSVERPDEDLSAGAIGCVGVERAALATTVELELPERAVIEVVADPEARCAVHPLGLAHDEDTERDWWCGGGDAFVWGRYRGERTVLAHDNIQIVWDIEPGDRAGASEASQGDVLGLVAGDSVVLRRLVGRPVRRIAPYGLNLAFAGPDLPPFGAHPLDAPTAAASTWESPRIVASLAALRGSVSVQNPFRGQKHAGPLRIHGSVATRFTGIFGWEHRTAAGALLGATGYGLDLSYDARVDRRPPPAMPTTDSGRLRIVELHLD